jgi:hypothetical protein
MTDDAGWLGVTNSHALQFFYEHLRDISEESAPPSGELLYNASVLAHFATTSTGSAEFPSCPTNLTSVFEVFVLDRSLTHDPEILEAAASQCLLLTGFFNDQLKHRHNVDWYASLGAGFYDHAAHCGHDRERTRMMMAMAARFEFWRRQQRRLARELRELPMLLFRRPINDPLTG